MFKKNNMRFCERVKKLADGDELNIYDALKNDILITCVKICRKKDRRNHDDGMRK